MKLDTEFTIKCRMKTVGSIFIYAKYMQFLGRRGRAVSFMLTAMVLIPIEWIKIGSAAVKDVEGNRSYEG